jgi:Deoxynucleoside kinase
MKCFLRCVNTKSNKASLISSTTRQQLRKLSENRPLLLSIEGNIGAGKSTLIDALRLSHPELNFVNEPLGIWSQLKNDSGSHSLMSLHSVAEKTAH